MARPGKHEKPIGFMGLGEGMETPIYESDYDDEDEEEGWALCMLNAYKSCAPRHIALELDRRSLSMRLET